MSEITIPNEEIHRISELGVNTVKKIDISLDYSKSSLQVIDRILEQANHKLNMLVQERKQTDEFIKKTTIIWGCYIGEVIQKIYGGYWIKDDGKYFLKLNKKNLDPIGFVNSRIVSESLKKTVDYYGDIFNKINTNTLIKLDDSQYTNRSIPSDSEPFQHERPISNKLLQAYDLYQKGDKHQAGNLFGALVKEDIINASAWYGLALCLDDADKKRYCLQKVLSLEPNHEEAKKDIEKLSQNLEMKKCPYCAEQITTEAIFCSYCGKELDNSSDIKTFIDSYQDAPSFSDNQGVTKHTFQPRFITAAAGLGILVGTFFPWIVLIQGGEIVSTILGITIFPGMLTFLAGGTILLSSLLIKTKSGSRTAPVASSISVLVFLASCGLSFWVSSGYEGCFEDFFTPIFDPPDSDNGCINPSYGSGLYFSMFSLIIAMITGRIKNPSIHKINKDE